MIAASRLAKAKRVAVGRENGGAMATMIC
eukprot:COSAG06_NODE_20903_length_777_cov_0.837758_2_plen_28_part_01